MNPSNSERSLSLAPDVPSELRSETKEFLHTLHSYLDCRKQMDAKYLEVDEFQRIRARTVTDDSNGGIMDSNGKLKPEYRQESPDGTPVKSLDELYQAAELARPILKTKVDRLVQQVCQDCNSSTNGVTIKFPELKGRERATAKAQDDYTNRLPGPGIAWLYDILRCSFWFETADQVLRCIDLLEQDPSIHIVKVQNRFQTPALTGYRDINFHVRIRVDDAFYHICEIQVHHQAIQCLDHILDTHKYYEYFRAYFAGATGSLTERLNDLKLIGEGAAVDESFLDTLLEESKEEDMVRLQRLAKLFEDQLCEHGWALKVWERVHFLEMQRSGTDDSISLSDTFYHMAGSLRKLGKVEQSLELYQTALDMRKEYAGEDPINGMESYRYALDRSLMQRGGVSLADIYNDMGLLLFEQQSNLRESMLHFQRSLKIKQEHYKDQPYHPSIAKTYSNLGMVLRFNNQLHRALEMYENVLDIYQTCYGEDHLAVAETYHSIALVSYDLESFSNAMKMNQLALDLFRKHLGEEHIQVAEIYHDMGNVLRSTSPTSAMELFEKSLTLKSKMLPSAHPSIGDTYCRMGDTLLIHGVLEEAMESYQKALEVYQSVYGDCHSDIADTYKGMALVLKGQGDLEGFKKYESKSLEIIRAVFQDSMHLR